MKYRASVTTVLLLFSTIIFAQGKKSEPQTLTVKGFVFFSNNNVQYIDTLKYRHVILQPFTRDIFIPFKSFDAKQGIVENFLNADLKHGIEMDLYEQRETLRKQAVELKNDTTGNECYKEKTFALLPVLCLYKKQSDFPKVYNCDNAIILLNNKKVISFHYTTPSVEIIGVKPLCTKPINN